MLERYRRTFPVTQAVIAVATIALLVKLPAWQSAAVFFVMIQLGAVAGSLWAACIKRRVEHAQGF